MPTHKQHSPLGSWVEKAALAGIAAAAFVALKRRTPRVRPDDARSPSAQIRALDARGFHRLCVAYYQSRQFRLRNERSRGDVHDAVLYFGSLPHPVAVLRILGGARGPVDVDAIHEVAAIMARNGVTKGMVHARDGYTDAAVRYAAANHIRLVSGQDLARNIAAMPEPARAAMQRLLRAGATTVVSKDTVY